MRRGGRWYGTFGRFGWFRCRFFIRRILKGLDQVVGVVGAQLALLHQIQDSLDFFSHLSTALSLDLASSAVISPFSSCARICFFLSVDLSFLTSSLIGARSRAASSESSRARTVG